MPQVHEQLSQQEQERATIPTGNLILLEEKRTREG
jgi:hypothetical protein